MNILIGLITCLFILSLQVQWTGTISGSIIRLSSSDLLLIPLFLLVLLHFYQKEGFRRVLGHLQYFRWFLLFSAWLTITLFVGYFENGSMSNWALVNKYFGWFLLVGYFFLGNLLGQSTETRINMFMKTLFITSALISFISIIQNLFFQQYLLGWCTLVGVGRLIGFLVNPNAYGLLCVFIVLLQLPLLMSNKLFKFSTHILLIVPNIMAIFFSLSRTAIIGIMIGVFVLIIKNYKAFELKKTGIVLAIAGCLSLFNFNQASEYVSRVINDDDTTKERIGIIVQATQWWLSKPLTGIGLGSYVSRKEKISGQERTEGSKSTTIHNTFLWLLTDTGIIGLSLFLWFIRRLRNDLVTFSRMDNINMFLPGLIATLPVLFFASLTNEIIYQRYLWFFFGLILSHLHSSIQLSRVRNTAFVPAFSQ